MTENKQENATETFNKPHDNNTLKADLIFLAVLSFLNEKLKQALKEAEEIRKLPFAQILANRFHLRAHPYTVKGNANKVTLEQALTQPLIEEEQEEGNGLTLEEKLTQSLIYGYFSESYLTMTSEERTQAVAKGIKFEAKTNKYGKLISLKTTLPFGPVRHDYFKKNGEIVLSILKSDKEKFILSDFDDVLTPRSLLLHSINPQTHKKESRAFILDENYQVTASYRPENTHLDPTGIEYDDDGNIKVAHLDYPEAHYSLDTFFDQNGEVDCFIEKKNGKTAIYSFYNNQADMTLLGDDGSVRTQYVVDRNPVCFRSIQKDMNTATVQCDAIGRPSLIITGTNKKLEDQEVRYFDAKGNDFFGYKPNNEIDPFTSAGTPCSARKVASHKMPDFLKPFSMEEAVSRELGD